MSRIRQPQEEPKRFGYQDASSLPKTEFGTHRISPIRPTREELEWLEIKNDPKFRKLENDLIQTLRSCITLEDKNRTKALTWMELFRTFPSFFNKNRYTRIQNYFKQQRVDQWELAPRFRPEGYVHQDRFTPFMTYLYDNIPRYIKRHLSKSTWF